jgi:hypothetical protein
MIFTLNLSELLHLQYTRLRGQVIDLDQKLALRYGSDYDKIKQQVAGTKDWYKKTRSEAESSGTIPIEKKQEETNQQVAQAGSAAARKEQSIRKQLKELWYTVTHS